MKIIINPSHGSFDISELAYFELIRRNAKCLKSSEIYWPLFEFLNLIGEENKDNFENKLVPYKDEFYKHPLYKDYLISENFVYLLTEYTSGWRYDSTLISIVEELGQPASGEDSHLKVVEIPDGIQHYIDIGDSGFESIHENHRVWI